MATRTRKRQVVNRYRSMCISACALGRTGLKHAQRQHDLPNDTRFHWQSGGVERNEHRPHQRVEQRKPARPGQYGAFGTGAQRCARISGRYEASFSTAPNTSMPNSATPTRQVVNR